METTQVNRKQIDDLRAWFFAKDRSISLAQNTLYYLFAGGQANAAYMSTAFISETVLSVATASITFSNIPQDFRRLQLVMQVRSSNATEGDSVLMRFNGDGGANYDWVQIFGSSATASASTNRAQTNISPGVCDAANARGNNYSPLIVWISDYSRNNAEARVFALSSQIGNLATDTDMFVVLRAGNWRNTNVITSIVLTSLTGATFAINSRFQLYGIL